MTGVFVGTPDYMSPEQYLGKREAGEIDGRSDIYSLGVLLFQMVTGQLPFKSDTPYGLIVQHLEAIPRSPSELSPDRSIPQSLSQAILKAMEKDRARRFQSAEEFARALDYTEQASNALSLNSASLFGVKQSMIGNNTLAANLPYPARDDTPRGSRITKRLTLYLLIVLLVVGSIGVFGVFHFRLAGRDSIELAVNERLKSSASRAIRAGTVHVSVRGTNVELTGTVSSAEESSDVAALFASVAGVTGITNRLIIIENAPEAKSQVNELLNSGQQLLDAGDYSTAIENFQKVLATEPNNGTAHHLLQQAQKAQQTEDELLKSRR